MCNATEILFSLTDRVRGVYSVELHYVSMFVKCVLKHTLRPRLVVLAAVSSLVAPGLSFWHRPVRPRRDGLVAVVTLWFQFTGFDVHFVFPVYYEYYWDDWNIIENCVKMLSWSHVFVVLRNKEFLLPDSIFLLTLAMIACVATMFDSLSDAYAELLWKNYVNDHVADVLTPCVAKTPADNDISYKEWARH